MVSAKVRKMTDTMRGRKRGGHDDGERDSRKSKAEDERQS